MLPRIHGEFNVGTEPELRFTPSGKAICSFRAVASERREEPKGSGNWVDGKQSWVTVNIWGPTGEHVAESVESGMKVVIEGRLEIQEWEDKEGAKRLTPTVHADAIGPSLAWATAKVTKVQSQGGGGQQGRQQPAQQGQAWPGQQGADPWQNSQDEPPF